MTAHNDKTVEQQRLGKFDVQKATITDTGATYYALKPGYHTHVTLNKATSEATIKFTSDYTKGDTVDNAVFGTAVSTGADDYQKGSTPGLTGVEVNMTVDNADMALIITQFREGD